MVFKRVRGWIRVDLSPETTELSARKNELNWTFGRASPNPSSNQTSYSSNGAILWINTVKQRANGSRTGISLQLSQIWSLDLKLVASPRI